MGSQSCPSRIVFVCTANQIRSVFAERAAVQLNLRPPWLGDVPIISRGLFAVPGKSAYETAIETARRFGVDLTGHESAPLRAADCDNAWIIGMTPEHLNRSPDAWRRDLLGDFSDTGAVADPVGLGGDRMAQAFELILSGLQSWSRCSPDAPAPR